MKDKSHPPFNAPPLACECKACESMRAYRFEDKRAPTSEANLKIGREYFARILRSMN